MVTVPHPASRSVMEDISDAFTGLAAIFAGDEPGAADSKPADEAGMASNQEDDYSDVSDRSLLRQQRALRARCASCGDGEKTPLGVVGLPPRGGHRVTRQWRHTGDRARAARTRQRWREALEEVARLAEAHDILLFRIDLTRRSYRPTSFVGLPSVAAQVIATLDVALNAPGPYRHRDPSTSRP